MSRARLNNDYHDVIVVGAGFGGMYALHKFRDHLGLKVKVLEQGDGVGGTWYWNRYPGAHCDVPVLEYQYSFNKELAEEYSPKFKTVMAAQPEIEEYANFVKDKFNLAKDIQFDTKVVRCKYDDQSKLWSIFTNTNEEFRCHYFVTCVGCLSEPNVPDIKGMDAFKGELHFTSKYPKAGVDFTNKKVGLIGTGSSGIQSIPEIAKQCKQLYVFQRTPQYTLPASNTPISENYRNKLLSNFEKVAQFNDAFGNNKIDKLTKETYDEHPKLIELLLSLIKEECQELAVQQFLKVNV